MVDVDGGGGGRERSSITAAAMAVVVDGGGCSGGGGWRQATAGRRQGEEARDGRPRMTAYFDGVRRSEVERRRRRSGAGWCMAIM